jgi:hypothetical protein
MRSSLTRAWRRVVQSMGALLGIATVAAIAIGFSGQILFNAAAAQQNASPAVPGADASPPARPAAGVRPSATGATTACTRTFDGDGTGATDATADLQAFVDESPQGAVLCLRPDADYRMEGQLHLANRDGLTIDGRGARLFATERSGKARILIDHGGSDIAIRNLVIEGYWPEAGTADAVVLAYQGNHGIAIGGAHDVEVGPNVRIRNVGGDGVYMTAGTVGSEHRWADGIHVHDSTIERNGRMGVAITDGARNVVVEHNRLDEIALYAFDIEPNGEVFDGAAAGAEHVRFSNNMIGRYGLSPVLVPWLFAGTGEGPQTDVEVSRNVAIGVPLRIGVWNVKETGRSDFRILENWSDTQVSGPVMEFDGVDGLEVRDTWQPLTFGRLARVTDSRVVGVID